MKRIVKLLIMNVIFVFIMGTYQLAYEGDRLVDIPVPPNSSGYADFTSEEGEQKAKEYEQNKDKNQDRAESHIGKSSDNYLKNLKIEGYSLEPQFNSHVYNYKLYIENRTKKLNLNIMAEVSNEKAKIEGAGNIEIKPEQDLININVIAEDGNLKVYTIRIEKGKNRQKEINDSIIVILGIIIIVVSGVGINKIYRKKSKKS